MKLKNKYYLIIFILFFTSNFTFAQDKNNTQEDVVYLKDGSILRGAILENIENEKIVIEIIGGNVMVVNAADVKNVIQVEKSIVLGKPIPKMRYTNISEIGITTGNSENVGESSSIMLQTINGLRLKNGLSIGLGMGIHFYEDLRLLPIFIDARWEVLPNKVATPFFFADAGYSLSFSEGNAFDEHKGGRCFSVGTGVNIGKPNKAKWTISLGFQHQKAAIDFIWWSGGETERIYKFNRLVFKTGVSI